MLFLHDRNSSRREMHSRTEFVSVSIVSPCTAVSAYLAEKRNDEASVIG